MKWICRSFKHLWERNLRSNSRDKPPAIQVGCRTKSYKYEKNYSCHNTVSFIRNVKIVSCLKGVIQKNMDSEFNLE